MIFKIEIILGQGEKNTVIFLERFEELTFYHILYERNVMQCLLCAENCSGNSKKNLIQQANISSL